MGYQQYFGIDHDADPATLKAMTDSLDKIHDGPWKSAFLTGEADSPMSWSSFDDDMISLSHEFPKVLLTIAIRDPEQSEPHTQMWIRGGDAIKHYPKVIWPDPPNITQLGIKQPMGHSELLKWVEDDGYAEGRTTSPFKGKNPFTHHYPTLHGVIERLGAPSCKVLAEAWAKGYAQGSG